jgi:DNA-binding NarL/FixJ family response regulator
VTRRMAPDRRRGDLLHADHQRRSTTLPSRVTVPDDVARPVINRHPNRRIRSTSICSSMVGSDFGSEKGPVVKDSTAVAVARPTRISVRADDPLTATGIAAMLAGRPEYHLLPRNREHDADIIVVATATATVEFVQALRHLATQTTARFVLVLDGQFTADLATAADTGLAAVIPRPQISAERLNRTLTAVASGHAELPTDLQGRLLDQIRRLQRDVLAPRGLNAHGLDNREVEVLRMLAEGMSVLNIADKLLYSERTVKNILHSLIARLGFRNRTQAVAYALRAGVI